MTDGRNLTFSKIAEVADGSLEAPTGLSSIAGLTDDPSKAHVFSFLETHSEELVDEQSFFESEWGAPIASALQDDAARRAIEEGNEDLAARLIGVTETEFDGSAVRVAATIIEQLRNNDATAYVLGAGNPNTGKTGQMLHLVEVAKYIWPDLHVVTNIESASITDTYVSSMHELMIKLLEHRDRPQAVVIDEGSTHFDARTYRTEVAEQWTPAAKRFAKIGVEFCGIVIHTGKDGHPECKRLTTCAYYKPTQTAIELYENWPAESDSPNEPIYPDPIDPIEEHSGTYDPDDQAPWSWNLEADLFTHDLEWGELLTMLIDRGPMEN